MGLNFRKSLGLGNGLKLNINKHGISLSKKIGNTTVTLDDKGGIHGNIKIPKTGISYSKQIRKRKSNRNNSSVYTERTSE